MKQIDVSSLPTVVFGQRDPIFWGVLGLIAIETTMVGLLIASYLYLRANFLAWPPTDVGRLACIAAALETGVALLSIVPSHFTNLMALQLRLRPMRNWLLAATVLVAIFLALRWWEFSVLPFRWDSDAHGSVFYMLLGLNTFHALGGLLENGALLLVLFRGPVELKLCADVQVSGFYWYFTVATWLAIAATLYLEPYLLPR
jgi:cytochrome c oxidase subunit 3